MKQLTDDLWQSSRYSSGMLNSHAYFLQHPAGNVLFYNTADPNDLDHIEQLGGIRYQLLSHRDEAGASQARIRDRFASQLGCSELESSHIERYSTIDLHFSTQDQALDDIQILHTPGHTDGSICFFYPSPTGQNYLFSGDSLFLWQNEWSTLVLDSAGGSHETMKQSLEQLKTLSPDLVLSSGFVGEHATRPLPDTGWEALLDAQIAKLNTP